MDDSDKAAKRPGEKKPGKFHYNPGNMSGKTIVEPCIADTEEKGERTRHDDEPPPEKGKR